MIKIITIILFLVLQSCLNQNKDHGQQNFKYSKHIILIDSICKSIDDKIQTLDSVKKEVFNLSTEGGEVIGYFDLNDFVKISTVYYGETGNTKEEYYFNKKKIIFVSSVMEWYKEPFDLVDSVEIKEEIKEDYYFTFNKKLCAYFRDNVFIPKDSTIYNKKESKIFSSIDEYIKLLNRKRKELFY